MYNILINHNETKNTTYRNENRRRCLGKNRQVSGESKPKILGCLWRQSQQKLYDSSSLEGGPRTKKEKTTEGFFQKEIENEKKSRG